MRRNQKGFTLMELMVVIVIVAILAAVAVPLYINYVKDAQRTEAKGAIGAIITAEQVYFQQYGAYAEVDTLINRGLVDLTDIQGIKWDFTSPVVAAGPPAAFTIQADQVVSSGTALVVTYGYKRDGTGAGWAP